MRQRSIRFSTHTYSTNTPAQRRPGKSRMTMNLPFKNRIGTLCTPFSARRVAGDSSAANARQPHGTVARRLALLSLALAIPLAAMARAAPTPNPGPTPLADKVRNATSRYWDVNVAIHEGFVPATPCVSGPSEGAMGVHYVMLSRLNDPLKVEEPEALIYEPMPNGALRFVGVEYIALATNVTGGAASLEGHLLNFVDEPNRFGLPAFYELHVWAWQDNPKGSFADWNTNVSCDAQRAPPPA